MKGESRHRLAGLGVVILVLAAIAVVASTYALTRIPGPLATDSGASVEFGLNDAQVATWGMVLPPNPTAADIRIESIELVDATGLAIVGVSVSYPAVDGSIVNTYGYPPAGIVTHPVEGSVLPAAGSTTPQVQVLVGFHLQAGAPTGAIGGLRIRYSSTAGRFETTLPWTLKVNRNSP